LVSVTASIFLRTRSEDVPLEPAHGLLRLSTTVREAGLCRRRSWAASLLARLVDGFNLLEQQNRRLIVLCC